MVKTTDFQTGGGDEAGAARGGTPGPVWRERESAVVKTTDFQTGGGDEAGRQTVT